jgi:hypothetical protein
VRLAIRPEHVRVRLAPLETVSGEFPARVADLIYRGASAELLLHVRDCVAGGDLIALSADLPAEGLSVQRGDTVAVRLPDEHCLIFEEDFR